MVINETNYLNPEYSGTCFTVHDTGILEVSNCRPNCKQFNSKRELKEWLRHEFNLMVDYKANGYTQEDYSFFYNHLESLPYHFFVNDYQYETDELLAML